VGADADAMRIALAAHDEVLCKAIEAHGGWLFKHTGDGVCAAFASPKSAVDAAVTAQRALELPVRMGIATGEAELREADYFGAVLNRAARVMAAGHGGQVLLADSTAGLLSGVDLVDLGPRRLRDLPTPVHVFQVQAEGLRTDFPPLRALDASPGNLRPAPDEVMAFFVRGISGPQYRRRAVQAGMELLHAVGHGTVEGPWLELGAAVNAGVAYVGNVGEAVVDFTALGDTVNVAARMQQGAAGGELLVAGGVADELMAHAPQRTLMLRGHELPMEAFVLTV
jgi:class 3 adenylate cyclase